jgi:two-component system sensor histidine kinase UhpB
MWRSTSLRNRLNLIFGSLLALWLVVDVSRILVEASVRARAETENAMRLTKEFVATALDRLQDASEPERAIETLLASLENVRHVRVGVGEPSFASAIVLAASNGSKAPFWFRSLVNAPNQVVSIPIVFNDRRMNSIVIVADSSDVVDNAWTGARDAALTGALLALIAMAATNLLVGRALKPLDAAGLALARLEAGDYSARAEVGGPPEFVNLNTKINSLAGALSGLERANAELMERAVDAHDEERRVIAHELHDEFGPHLFALRASAAVLTKKLDGIPEAQAAAAVIASQVETLQNQNRRILADLRPAALEELGLVDALGSLIAHWRRAEPAIDVSLGVDPRAGSLDARASQMAYRFVQEALTNAFRHAGATRIEVTLRFEDGNSHDARLDPGLAGLVIRVADDGRGLQGQGSGGMGLSGMRDRVRMLGGETLVVPLPEGGLAVEARFGAPEASGRAKLASADGGMPRDLPNTSG